MDRDEPVFTLICFCGKRLVEEPLREAFILGWVRTPEGPILCPRCVERRRIAHPSSIE